MKMRNYNKKIKVIKKNKRKMLKFFNVQPLNKIKRIGNILLQNKLSKVENKHYSIKKKKKINKEKLKHKK